MLTCLTICTSLGWKTSAKAWSGSGKVQDGTGSR